MDQMLHAALAKAEISKMSEREPALFLPLGSVGKHDPTNLLMLVLKILASQRSVFHMEDIG